MGSLRSRSRSQQKFKMSVNVCPDIFWITEDFFYQIWYGDVVSWARVSCRNLLLLLLLSSRSRSQQGLSWSKYLFYIFWTVDSLSTELGLMMHHHKPECPVKRVGLLQSGLRSQWRVKMLMFDQMVSSEPPSILFPNLVLWCIIMQELIWSKYENVYCIFWTADPLLQNLVW